MLEIKDRILFGKVVADALVAIDTNAALGGYDKARWTRAIAKAVVRVESDWASITWMEEGAYLLIWNQETNGIYQANGACQCRAFEQSQPCWHRSLAKLVKTYLKKLEAASVNMPLPAKTLHDILAEQCAAPYLRETPNKPVERCGGVRI